MSIIEQAAKRLEQLQRAGVAVPWSATGLHPPEEANAPLAPEAGATPLAAPAAVEPGFAPLSMPTPPRKRTPRAAVRPTATVNLDLDRLNQAGYLVPHHARSEVAQQFRKMKAPLLKNARQPPEGYAGPASLIMVTSALPGEGKTFCAINLAMSMALEVDTSVVLVDADVMRPSVLDRIGVPGPAIGLLDLLTDEQLPLSEALLHTNIPKLSILPSGTPNTRSTELLGSTLMESLLYELATQYADSIVIFDAPPLLLTTEARVLASRVGQVLMVVEAWKTQHSVVTEAFAALENCPLVMSVLNKCAPTPPNRHHGYYYG